ncbi:YqcI/YcgG family protein [Streptomyces somaliensis DSM 40738]|uniref:YqcI/YcgG family protein n=1 Tax=Streptomyces somaliensis (strain ATCC 33201 / DSM 40738 / JCM 12659 / KCTC 9044 / NCTC 11332 / NRRL B-12077 / IP 733) TaxID=1134445 RepID=A0AA44D9Z2_STRE0|nr:YqcI/YcgG family protein [Streptomyces somaliensis]MCQ0024275.1 YqcI/YcgG family protein [Streptomyces somaliensis DSM 40738]NKY12887.1 YqcI/YcgG family protein [Streptomyces somaliensis DSM 40738]
MDESRQHTKLIAQERIGEDGEKWHRVAFEEIGERLADPGFPCVFSRNAFRKQLVKFVFVEDCTEAGVRHLAEGLKEYVGISRDWDGRLDTAYPMIAVFPPDAVDARSVEEYHAFGWKILQELHGIDPAPWPEEVGRDPGSESWSMCFDGMPLFCNMSCPAHRVRRSRNLGENFALVINPRERFDVFAGDTPSGRKVRANIRDRIHRYDGVPHSPQLGSYGTGALEWLQYGLAEENAERTGECPFTFRGTAEIRKES